MDDMYELEGFILNGKKDGKVNYILNLTSDVNIVIDSHCTRTDLDKIRTKYRVKMSRFECIGNMTKSR